MAYRYIVYEKKDHAVYLTINRPEVMNALHHWAHLELAAAFEDFEKDEECRVAIITGAGERAFCAGHDLKDAQAMAAREATPTDRRPPFGGITGAHGIRKPIIAAVNGVALGGGFEIALACDLLIAAEHARFGLPEPRVGLIAGAGGVHRLPRQIPLKLAMGMILTGRQITAQEAHRLGLVNEIVPMADLRAAAERWAGEIAECAPLSVRLSKEAVLRGLGLPLDAAMASDAEAIARVKASEDFLEGSRAFAQKRKPQWKGR